MVVEFPTPKERGTLILYLSKLFMKNCARNAARISSICHCYTYLCYKLPLKSKSQNYLFSSIATSVVSGLPFLNFQSFPSFREIFISKANTMDSQIECIVTSYILHRSLNRKCTTGNQKYSRF